MHNIPLSKPFTTPSDRLSIDEVLSSGWLTQGSKVQELESRFFFYGKQRIFGC